MSADTTTDGTIRKPEPDNLAVSVTPSDLFVSSNELPSQYETPMSVPRFELAIYPADAPNLSPSPSEPYTPSEVYVIPDPVKFSPSACVPAPNPYPAVAERYHP